MRLCALLVPIGMTALMVGFAVSPKPPVVGLDCYHNQQTPQRYTWGQQGAGGYSQFGKLLKGLGAKITSVRHELTAGTLSPLSAFIIVDPNTRHPGLSYSPHPHYIKKVEASVLEAWVKRGGVLVLMGNNRGNCEFIHLNKLSSRFGIHFNDDTANTGGPGFNPVFNEHCFKGIKRLHIVGMCSLVLAPPAKAVVTYHRQVLMATAKIAKGRVFAVGDPWLYNEYINHADNLRAARQLFQWLLKQVRR